MITAWYIPILLAAGAVCGFCFYGALDPPGLEYQRGFKDAKNLCQKCREEKWDADIH